VVDALRGGAKPSEPLRLTAAAAAGTSQGRKKQSGHMASQWQETNPERGAAELARNVQGIMSRGGCTFSHVLRR
jgi:hypothetical protein